MFDKNILIDYSKNISTTNMASNLRKIVPIISYKTFFEQKYKSRKVNNLTSYSPVLDTVDNVKCQKTFILTETGLNLVTCFNIV